MERRLEEEGIQIGLGERVIVTEHGLDNWRAQQYGVTVDDFPRMKPVSMSDELYEELRRKYVQR